MVAVSTGSIRGIVRHVACSNNGLVFCFPPYSYSLVRRDLSIAAPPSSPVPLANNITQLLPDDSSGLSANNTVGKSVAPTNGGSSHEVQPVLSSLQGRVNQDILKALMVHPLRFETMTLVQERVTALLPDLVRPWDPDVAVPPNVPKPFELDRKPPAIDWTRPRDILVRAKAGTGKTFAYLIPAIESRLNHIEDNANLAVVKAGLGNSPDIARPARLAYRRNSAGPLILAPTRESAIQIASHAQKLTVHRKDFEVRLLVGGSGKVWQTKEWTESPRDLVVATPGRLRDLLANEQEFRQGLKSCPVLILDEVDRLLSIGFRDDIDAIISFLPRPPIRQTFLFSATVSRAVRQLASWILSPNHTFIDATPPEPGLAPRRNEKPVAYGNRVVSSDDEELSTHDRIKQFHTLCPTPSDQLPILLKLLAHDQLIHGSNSNVIVFCPTVQMMELSSMLLRSLVGEMLPEETTEIVTIPSKTKRSAKDPIRLLFHKAGGAQGRKPTVLVSSEVSARGVDYPGITRVIQIGIPSRDTTYIRRIGRVARSVNSPAPGKGKEDKRPIVRADLLLLPWEAGYMDWQLTSLPIKSLPVSALDEQVASLSSRSPTFTTECLVSTCTEIQHRVDPADVRRTAASLLGYYLPLAPSLRLQPNAILAGISSWACECFNVTLPTIKRLPRKFVEAYEQSMRLGDTKGLFVDGLKVAGPSLLGKAKSKNRSVWEGADKRRKRPKRWH